LFHDYLLLPIADAGSATAEVSVAREAISDWRSA
jgi:hypothetical protein